MIRDAEALTEWPVKAGPTARSGSAVDAGESFHSPQGRPAEFPQRAPGFQGFVEGPVAKGDVFTVLADQEEIDGARKAPPDHLIP